MRISIIIPTLNEARILDATLRALTGSGAEIIVSDGGSVDRTRLIARRYTSHVIAGKKGRGVQQHLGAQMATGDVLIFLHADTLLPPDYQAHVTYAFKDSNVVFGAFRLGIFPTSPALLVIAFMADLRSRLLALPYGDQAIFVRRSAYVAVGGFRDWPLMEDVDFVRRLRALGAFRLAPAKVRTSARRWQKENLLRTTLRNWSLIIRYGLGASPDTLFPEYPDRR